MANSALKHGQYLDLAMSPDIETIGQLKAALAKKINIDAENIHFIYKDQPLDDRYKLWEHGIEHKGHLHFVHVNRDLLYSGHSHLDKLNFIVTTERHGVDSNGEKLEKVTIYSKIKSEQYPDLTFSSIRLSCESDPYKEGEDYGGFILYGWERSTSTKVVSQWTLNGKRCQSAYMVIQNTNSQKVQYMKHMGAPGKIHGAIYWNVFGRNENPDKAEGEGFAVRMMKNNHVENCWHSMVFNGHKDAYHEGKKEISVLGRVLVRNIIADWEKSGTRAIGKTYYVKDLH